MMLMHCVLLQHKLILAHVDSLWVLHWLIQGLALSVE